MGGLGGLGGRAGLISVVDGAGVNRDTDDGEGEKGEYCGDEEYAGETGEVAGEDEPCVVSTKLSRESCTQQLPNMKPSMHMPRCCKYFWVSLV